MRILPLTLAAAATALVAGCGRDNWHTVATPALRVRTADIQPTHNGDICEVFRQELLPQARLDGATGYWAALGGDDPRWNTMVTAPHFAQHDVWLCYYRADAQSDLPGMLVRHRDGADYRATILIDGSGEWVPDLVYEDD